MNTLIDDGMFQFKMLHQNRKLHNNNIFSIDLTLKNNINAQINRPFNGWNGIYSDIDASLMEGTNYVYRPKEDTTPDQYPII